MPACAARVATLLVCCCFFAACRSAEKTDTQPQPAPTTAASVIDQPILYHRTGGFAGVDERLVIWPDGYVQMASRHGPALLGASSHEHVQRLEPLLRNFQRLSSRTNPAVAMDTFHHTIIYRGKSVSADDVSMPPEMRHIVDAIQTLIDDLPDETPASS